MKIRRGRFAVIAANLIVLAGWFAASADNYSQWLYSCKITLNTKGSGANVSTLQSGFPILIRLTSATTAFSFAAAQSAGQDIRFAKSDGTHLPYQIERWDQANKLAEIWVKVDVNGGDSTQFVMMYWGNGAAADSSNPAVVFQPGNGFVGVWHLGESGTAVRKDATGRFDATPYYYTGVESTASGNVAKADTLSGGTGATGKYLRVATDMGRWDSTGLTYSVWAYPTSATDQSRLIDMCTDTTGPSENWQATSNILLSGYLDTLYASVFNLDSVGGKIKAPGTFLLNQWQNFAFTVNGKTVTVYKNGAQVATGTLTVPINNVARTWNMFWPFRLDQRSLLPGKT